MNRIILAAVMVLTLSPAMAAANEGGGLKVGDRIEAIDAAPQHDFTRLAMTVATSDSVDKSAEPTTPTVGHAPSWLPSLLILIAVMFAAAIIAGLVWRQPAPEPSPADDHSAHGSHDAHATGGASHH